MLIEMCSNNCTGLIIVFSLMITRHMIYHWSSLPRAISTDSLAVLCSTTHRTGTMERTCTSSTHMGIQTILWTMSTSCHCGMMRIPTTTTILTSAMHHPISRVGITSRSDYYTFLQLAATRLHSLILKPKHSINIGIDVCLM